MPPSACPSPSLPRLLGGLVLRRWAVAAGTTPGGLVRGGAAVALVLGGLGGALTGRAPERGDDLLALALVVATWAVAAGFGLLVAHATTVPPSLGFLRTLPVGRRPVEGAAALLLGVVGLAGLLVLGPPAVIIGAAASGRSAGAVSGVLVLVVSGGMAAGAVLHGLAGRVAAGTVLGPLRLTLAVLGWFGLVGASVAAPLPVLLRLGDATGALALAPLGWSLPWLALVDPGPGVVLGAVAVTAALTAAAVAARPAVAPRAASPVRPVRVAGPAALTRVEARRLLRHPRTLEALLVAGVTGAVLAATAAWATRRLPATVDPWVLPLLGAQVTSAPAALARGLSDRRRPAESLLGIASGPHVAALTAGTLVVVLVASVPALVLVGTLVSPATAGGWLAALVPFTAVAVAVSTALTPELGDGSAEAGAVLGAAALTTALVALVGRLGTPVLAALSPATALAALLAAAALERSHRRPS
ncbi:MAG: hypothetical protein H6518_07215 [Microthrixaceae bacterium]|nr:hypothetical protein [Microthrixaceae bacterium]